MIASPVPRFLLPLVLCVPSTGQQTPEPGDQGPSSQRVVVTATRTAEDPFDLPWSTEVLDGRLLRRRSYRTAPQALRDVPGVMVQETAYGHGSPYIRGFTSFRNLFLIDGIRLNNSVFRPGPNQYWNTVDAWSLDRLEVVKGPSSVLYGSDAVGGTVQAFTARPFTWTEGPGVAYGGRTLLRWSAAEDSVTGRGEVSVGITHDDGARTGILVGATIKRFGDLEGGEETGRQPETGYDEETIDIKIEHHFDDRLRLVAMHQRVFQDDVPRTHRTVSAVPFAGTSTGSDLRRNFDQTRYLSYVQLIGEGLGDSVESFRASLSWQVQKELRDRIRGNGNQEFQGFEVGTFGAAVQAETPSSLGRLTYGMEYYRDRVDSFLRRPASPDPADAIQGPVADDATYDLLGVFVQDTITGSDRLELTLGARFNWAQADADSVRDPVTNTRFGLEDDWSNLLGSARFLYRLVPDRLHLFGGVSQGFRAPNLSDLSRFDSARSGEFEIPAPGLDAEEYLQYEVGCKVQGERIAVQASWFYTDIEDQILRFPTGNTNAAGEAEVTKANVGDGYIQGVEVGASWRVADQWELFGNATWMEGRIENFENASSSSTNDYPTRLMPLTWQTGLRWEEEGGTVWAESVVVHTNRQDKLSFNDRRDTSRIPPGGTPQYTVWTARAGWQLSDHTALTFLLENITDADYRIHGSGLNRPGRNFVLAVETTW